MLAPKTDLASLKTKVDNLDVDNIKNFFVDLSKLSNAVDNGVFKKTVYGKFPVKVTAIDTKITSTSRLVTKIQYDSEKHGLEKKIEDVNKRIANTSGLIKKNDANTNIEGR